jgi:hypothetical protein
MSDNYQEQFDKDIESYGQGYNDAARDYDDLLDDEYDRGYDDGYRDAAANREHYAFIAYVVLLMFFGLLIAL